MAHDNCDICNDGEKLKTLRSKIRLLQRHIKTIEKERNAAIKRFEDYAIANAHWGVENSIYRGALKIITRGELRGKKAQKVAIDALTEANYPLKESND